MLKLKASTSEARKKFLSFSLILLLLGAHVSVTSSAKGAERPLTFAQGIAKWGGVGTPAWGVGLTENFLVPSASALYNLEETSGRASTTLCSGLLDANCAGQKNLYHVLRLDICKESSQLSCIANFWAVDSAGKKTNGELVREILFDPKQAVVENIELNLPGNASLGGLWKLPGIKNSAGSENYFVSSNVTMFKNPTQNKFTYGEINNGIIAVEELTGGYAPPSLLPKGGSGGNGSSAAPDGRNCVVLEQGKCQAPVAFPSGYRFGMTLRMSEKLSGWYHGRLSLPLISISDWKKGQEISIEGEPVKVSSIDFVAPTSEFSEEQKSLFTNCIKGNCGGRGDIAGVAQTGGSLSHPKSMELVSKFANLYQERAAKTTSTWAFRNMFNLDGAIDTGKITRCTSNSSTLNGIVLTNALTYAAGPPSFDESTGSLLYKVASTHFEDNGTVASGTYDLTLRSDVARCLYNFSSAPIKAEVAITGDDGENRVATMIVKESDGWLYLSARGFTFSSPTIKVKLSQEKAPTPVVVAAKPTVVANKKSITCVKGKTTKKVVATNPKCPTGFKKK